MCLTLSKISASQNYCFSTSTSVIEDIYAPVFTKIPSFEQYSSMHNKNYPYYIILKWTSLPHRKRPMVKIIVEVRNAGAGA